MFAKPCGETGPLEARIADCNRTLVDLKGGRWFLVSRACSPENCDGTVVRVWRDEETKTIWSSTILTSQINARKFCSFGSAPWVFNHLPGNWKIASFNDYLFLQQRHISYQKQTYGVMDSPYYYWTDEPEKMAVIEDLNRPMVTVLNAPENPMNVVCKIAK